jgi:hypothetical protein
MLVMRPQRLTRLPDLGSNHGRFYRTTEAARAAVDSPVMFVFLDGWIW